MLRFDHSEPSVGAVDARLTGAGGAPSIEAPKPKPKSKPKENST
jgi:hypothetical protein